VLFFAEAEFPWMREDLACLGGGAATPSDAAGDRAAVGALAEALATGTPARRSLYSVAALRARRRADAGGSALPSGPAPSGPAPSAPVACALYYDDAYVDLGLAEETLGLEGGRGPTRRWVDSEYMHSGLREDGAKIFDRLLGMCRGRVPEF